jgi:uncharacterized protein
MKGYRKIKKHVLGRLEKETPDYLTYHNLHHTLDVLAVCNGYIKRNKLKEEDAKALRFGALLHDLGYTITVQEHEEKSAQLAEELMSQEKIAPQFIIQVMGLILATKIPQSPKTDLEKIICDADLDYLGRKDYPEISNRLFLELKALGIIQTPEEWHTKQISFIQNHSYHTAFARKHREPIKRKWLEKLENNQPL